MFDFIALDFETANRKQYPCAAGVAVVKNGQIVSRDYTLINPESSFDDICINVHGITPEQVEGAPTFPEFLAKWSAFMRHYPVVAHNMGTERSALEKSCARYKLALPRVTFYDTLQLYRANYPGKESYTLDALCSERGIELEHHNALSDAVGCAELMLSLQQDESAALYPSAYAEYNVWEVATAPAPAPAHRSAGASALVMPDVRFDDTPIELEGRLFVVTGDIDGHSRAGIAAAIEQHGGIVKSTLSKKINYLAVGPLDPGVVVDKVSHKSTKIVEAEKLRDKGSGVKIVRLTDLVKILFDES